MNVTLKLYASLSVHLPHEARQGNQTTLELAPGTSVGDVITQQRLPPRHVHLVLINGHFVPPEDRSKRVLAEGDTLAIWPPIAGG